MQTFSPFIIHFLALKLLEYLSVQFANAATTSSPQTQPGSICRSIVTFRRPEHCLISHPSHMPPCFICRTQPSKRAAPIKAIPGAFGIQDRSRSREMEGIYVSSMYVVSKRALISDQSNRLADGDGIKGGGWEGAMARAR